MSCNGCRVLRKGCSDNCMLRQCLQWIEDPKAQAHATVFVAKFFGRAGLFSFINAVSESQRPALFQSLFFEAVGRTINPVNGATGLLLSGKWEVCQAAVETVLRGGTLEPLPEYTRNDHQNCVHDHRIRLQRQSTKKKRSSNLAFDDTDDHALANCQLPDLDLCLTAGGLTSRTKRGDCRAGTPSSAEESETTTLGSSSSSADHCSGNNLKGTTKLLRLFI
ncbi:PREDICTED: LOB domain-containing protein 37-like [Prunus mume]|uniref:LOB domain-containing protein 37-like n=1 Tax=Prunus mume TaxID=102107 RepID=A0ABM0P9W4_PRUMU|nr:PREDICTED: LOB domain-containing protein 37-like [Prunus mume]